MSMKVRMTIVFETRTNGEKPKAIVERLAHELENAGLEYFEFFDVKGWDVTE